MTCPAPTWLRRTPIEVGHQRVVYVGSPFSIRHGTDNIRDSWKLQSYDHLSVQLKPGRSLKGGWAVAQGFMLRIRKAGKEFGYE